MVRRKFFNVYVILTGKCATETCENVLLLVPFVVFFYVNKQSRLVNQIKRYGILTLSFRSGLKG